MPLTLYLVQNHESSVFYSLLNRFDILCLKRKGVGKRDENSYFYEKLFSSVIPIRPTDQPKSIPQNRNLRRTERAGGQGWRVRIPRTLGLRRGQICLEDTDSKGAEVTVSRLFCHEGKREIEKEATTQTSQISPAAHLKSNLYEHHHATASLRHFVYNQCNGGRSQ